MYYCLYNYLTSTASDAISKNIININLFSNNKETNKEIATIIPLGNRLILNNYEYSFSSIGNKADKKKQVTKSDKEAFMERQKADEPKKK